MMGNCKDCRHWEQHRNGHNTEWSTCGAVDFLDQTENIGESDAAIFAHAYDDCGLESGLKTGPMFGCVQFQLKNTK